MGISSVQAPEAAFLSIAQSSPTVLGPKLHTVFRKCGRADSTPHWHPSPSPPGQAPDFGGDPKGWASPSSSQPGCQALQAPTRASWHLCPPRVPLPSTPFHTLSAPTGPRAPTSALDPHFPSESGPREGIKAAPAAGSAPQVRGRGNPAPESSAGGGGAPEFRCLCPGGGGRGV